MLRPTLAVAVGTLLATAPAVSGAGLYTKNTPVLQINSKNYDNLIAKSNYTSIVEFYAPWCGHCQNLKPAYEKAAKNLEGLAQVAAVNCDEDENKGLCAQFQVQGFPTLKIVRPGSKKGRPVVDDYQGERTAKGIVNAVVDKINNHVKRLSDKDIDDFLSKNNETAKALLFTEKGTTSALLRSVAIDFLDAITIGQVRNTQKKAVEIFGIETYPTLVLLPGGDKDGIVYDGELKKPAMVKFLSQVAEPNPVSEPAKPKTKGSKPKKAATTDSDASEPTTEGEEKITEPVDDANIQKPVVFEGPLPIPIVHEKEKLIKNCLNEKAHTCLLAFVPKEEQSDVAKKALEGLAELSHKHAQSKRHLFPMYEVHFEDEYTAEILKALELSPSEVQVVAVNARRGWWRLLEGGDYSHESIESWIDQIRMSEGVKRKLPEGIVVEATEEPVSAPEATPEAKSEPTPAPTDNEAADSADSPTPDVTPDAEVISESTASDGEPTAWSGADPTVQEDTAAAEKATKEPHVKDEL